MATNLQRVQAYCDALLNAAASPAQIDRLGIAFATDAARLGEYQAATQAQKLRIFLDCARSFHINLLMRTEAASASQTAANAAAAAAETALPETP